MEALFRQARTLFAALEASLDCVKLVGRDGRGLYMNMGGSQLMELDEPRVVIGQAWSRVPARVRAAAPVAGWSTNLRLVTEPPRVKVRPQSASS